MIVHTELPKHLIYENLEKGENDSNGFSLFEKIMILEDQTRMICNLMPNKGLEESLIKENWDSLNPFISLEILRGMTILDFFIQKPVIVK